MNCFNPLRTIAWSSTMPTLIMVSSRASARAPAPNQCTRADMALKVTESLHRLMSIRWATPLVVAVVIAFLAVNEIGYQRAVAGIHGGDEIYSQRAEVRRLQLLLQAAEAGQRGYLL